MWNPGGNGGSDGPCLGTASCSTGTISMMKHYMVNLIVIFTKNQDQAVQHLQFNFPPLPTKSVASYLFSKSSIKGFSHRHTR